MNRLWLARRVPPHCPNHMNLVECGKVFSIIECPNIFSPTFLLPCIRFLRFVSLCLFSNLGFGSFLLTQQKGFRGDFYGDALVFDVLFCVRYFFPQVLQVLLDLFELRVQIPCFFPHFRDGVADLHRGSVARRLPRRTVSQPNSNPLLKYLDGRKFFAQDSSHAYFGFLCTFDHLQVFEFGLHVLNNQLFRPQMLAKLEGDFLRGLLQIGICAEIA